MKKKLLRCTLIHCQIDVESDADQHMSIAGMADIIKNSVEKIKFETPAGVKISLGRAVSIHSTEEDF